MSASVTAVIFPSRKKTGGRAVKKIAVLVIGLSLWATGVPFAYRSDYPPFAFKDGPAEHLNAKPLVSLVPEKSDYRSKDGSVVVHLKEPKLYKVEFSLQVGKTRLVSPDQDMECFPWAVFQADLDNNGLDDFIVLYSYRGPGLGSHQDRVEIYLRKSKDEFEKISYDAFDAGSEDFIGPDGEGKYKIIITGFYQGHRHNYVTYDLFEFKDSRLVNADAKVKGFEKFVPYTFKVNDQDTTRLTPKERLLHTQEKDRSISYEEIT